ncbi:hypothetical protein [Pseudomonas auratipiscis]|uniref:Uncharacterized protein n=1 Tax=Pseudomonas auratipiscis TaxID=3115853 RepID=A0AB35WZD7_9PSED|nr:MULTISPECIES: hypothetical protein [unclassified Pseudomonas]MEE1868461.1 hypothetical protein [Pseudomonas sp. 120P]MEE1960864.1 hypothetical protein [Pseudomonas sp. 119P]
MGDWENIFGEAGMRESSTGSFNLNPRMVKRMTTLLFETAVEARQWAKDHPGQSIVKNPDGNGFIAHVLEWYNQHTGDTYLECEKEKHLAWEKEQDIRKKAATYANECIGGSRNEGYWLYENGHREFLITIYNEYIVGLRSISKYKSIQTASYSEVPRDSPLRSMPEYDYYKVQRELKPKLMALLPSPFPENYYPIRTY